MGQTRLSIIDLSPGGHQPMSTRDGRFTLVFNGEIYNYRELRTELRALGYRFDTDCDTEVLLVAWQHWGSDCLKRLVGMWAFAIHDAHERTLTCVRDAFGIKPFFYSHEGGQFVFASELPALTRLLTRTPGMNPQRMYEYLVFGTYDTGVSTFLSGVERLPPAHLLTIDLTRDRLTTTSRRWWWPSIDEQRISFDDAADELRHRFLDNIRLHLRSDVPVGAALSGGIDSSAIVGAIRHLEPDADIHAFSFVNTGHPSNEEHWIDLVAHASNAKVSKVHLEATNLATDLDDMILAHGEPFGSTSIYAQYRVYQRAKHEGVTVTLDGQGADELLAGYERYRGARATSLLRAGKVPAAVAFAATWRQAGGPGWPKAFQQVGLDVVPARFQALGYRLGGMDVRPDWLAVDRCRELGVHIGAPSWLREKAIPNRRLAQTLRHSLTSFGLQELLKHADRNSMRWSLEARVPYLTTQLAEFCLSLPEEYLISPNGQTKHVFRKAMRGIVPDQILDRRDKIGFETPEGAWLTELSPNLGEWLDGLDDIPLVRAKEARAACTAALGSSGARSWLAWRLVNAARWKQRLS